MWYKYDKFKASLCKEKKGAGTLGLRKQHTHFFYYPYSADTKLIKEGEESKRKSYQALVWFSQPLTQDIVDRCNKKGRQSFITYQKTPIRVFQR